MKPMSMTLAVLVTTMVVALGSPRLFAHELWVEPESHTVERTDIVKLTIRHGERFLGDAVKRDPRTLRRYELVEREKSQPTRGRAGGTVSFVRPASAGLAWVVYESRPQPHELDAAAFTTYLKEEGLDAIVMERARRGETQRPGRELYSRCAKSLIRIGAECASGHDTRVNLPLELLLDDNPYRTSGQAELAGRLLFRGRGLSATRVVAVKRDNPERLIPLITDSEGRFRLPGARPGVWMLTTIHMTRVNEPGEADWQSYWASLTFEIPQSKPARPAPAPPEERTPARTENENSSASGARDGRSPAPSEDRVPSDPGSILPQTSDCLSRPAHP